MMLFKANSGFEKALSPKSFDCNVEALHFCSNYFISTAKNNGRNFHNLHDRLKSFAKPGVLGLRIG